MPPARACLQSSDSEGASFRVKGISVLSNQIGVTLIADGLHFHVTRGYIDTAIAFSVLVEILRRPDRRSGASSAI